MENLFLPAQQWTNENGDPVFVVLFFRGKGTLKVPRYNSTFNSEFYGLQEGFDSFSHDENSCLIQGGDTSTFVANGLQALESRGYRRAAEASPPPPEVPNY